MEKKISESELKSICDEVKNDFLVTAMQQTDLSETEKQYRAMISLLRAIRKKLEFPEYMLGNFPPFEPTSPLDNIAETIRRLVDYNERHPQILVEDFLKDIFGKDKNFGITWRIF